jgi:hypothetical protein
MTASHRHLLLILTVVCAFGGLLLAISLQAGAPAQGASVTCQASQDCAAPRPAWMDSERARRFASVFRE